MLSAVNQEQDHEFLKQVLKHGFDFHPRPRLTAARSKLVDGTETKTENENG